MKTLLAAVLCSMGLAASAQQQWSDPYVPPHVKRSENYVETRGEALRAQVEQKLRAQFDGVDLAKSGTITREQARAAGFGFVAENFDAIDTRRAGAIRFDDLKRYLGL